MDMKLMELHAAYGKHKYRKVGIGGSPAMYHCSCGAFSLGYDWVFGYASDDHRHDVDGILSCCTQDVLDDWEKYVWLYRKHGYGVQELVGKHYGITKEAAND